MHCTLDTKTRSVTLCAISYAYEPPLSVFFRWDRNGFALIRGPIGEVQYPLIRRITDAADNQLSTFTLREWVHLVMQAAETADDLPALADLLEALPTEIGKANRRQRMALALSTAE